MNPEMSSHEESPEEDIFELCFESLTNLNCKTDEAGEAFVIKKIQEVTPDDLIFDALWSEFEYNPKRKTLGLIVRKDEDGKASIVSSNTISVTQQGKENLESDHPDGLMSASSLCQFLTLATLTEIPEKLYSREIMEYHYSPDFDDPDVTDFDRRQPIKGFGFTPSIPLRGFYYQYYMAKKRLPFFIIDKALNLKKVVDDYKKQFTDEGINYHSIELDLDALVQEYDEKKENQKPGDQDPIIVNGVPLHPIDSSFRVMQKPFFYFVTFYLTNYLRMVYENPQIHITPAGACALELIVQNFVISQK